MTKRYLPVKDNPNLVKDMDTGAVININTNKMKQAKEAKKRRLEKKKKFEQMEQELNELKETVQRLVGNKDV